MTLLGTAIVEAVLSEYGRSEVLTRLSDPFWLQALGAVLGMDWHSCGLTTSVMGALERGLHPGAPELGLYLCGGRGKYARLTLQELVSYECLPCTVPFAWRRVQPRFMTAHTIGYV